MFQLLSATIAIVLLPALSGCGKALPREAVSGAVTLDGEPLKEGSILFSPLASGPSAGGEIRQGRYELLQLHGPGPDKYRVEISAWRKTGQTIHDTERGAREELLEPLIPPRYNTESELEVTIQPGKKNEFNFQLTSRQRSQES